MDFLRNLFGKKESIVLNDFDDIEKYLEQGVLEPSLLPKQAFKPEKTTLLSWNNLYFQFVDNKWVILPGHPTDAELRGFSTFKERWSSGSWGVLYRIYVEAQKHDENDMKGDFNVKKFIHSSRDAKKQVKAIYKSPEDGNWYAAVYLLFSILRKADLIYVSTLCIEENSEEIILYLETPMYKQVENCINQNTLAQSGQSLIANVGSSSGHSDEVLCIYPDKIVCNTPLVKAGFLRAIGGFPRSGSLDLGKFDLKVAS